MAQREKLEGPDVCVALHTALRKLCDSKPTSCAYNLVHLICNLQITPFKFDAWRAYGELVAYRINAGDKPMIAARKTAAELVDSFLEMCTVAKQDKECEPDNCRTALYSLTCILDCFDEKDWKSFIGYL